MQHLAEELLGRGHRVVLVTDRPGDAFGRAALAIGQRGTRRRQLVVGFRIDAAEPFEVFHAQLSLCEFALGAPEFALDVYIR